MYAVGGGLPPRAPPRASASPREPRERECVCVRERERNTHTYIFIEREHPIPERVINREIPSFRKPILGILN